MRVTEEEAELYAHCVDAFCEGHQQERVPGVRQTVERTFGDDLGDRSVLPEDQAFTHLTSTSRTYLQWSDPEQRACPHCGGSRELADQERPHYPQLGVLLQAQQRAELARRGGPEAMAARLMAQREAELVRAGEDILRPEADPRDRQLDELREQVAKLTALVEGEPDTAPRARRKAEA
jgi:hypothetical protein